MKILALEFSSSQRSAAVVQKIGDSISVAEMIETGGRVGRPFEMIEGALREARLEREQIDCLAIGTGPGSYNGIRGAISVAQGWALATSARLLAVSSVDCLVRAAQQQGCFGRVNVVIDAQRNEFYLAAFDLSAAEAVAVRPLKIVTEAEVRLIEQTGERIVGPELARWFPTSINLLPRAAILGQLALSRKDFVSGEQLQPIYLRETSFVKAPPSRILPP
jgi:tRNA threonylcarbamoyl adenosine modification protein YeaZ